MSVPVTVVIPTFNPRMDYLQSVLDALRIQTLPLSEWDLLVVDNNSAPTLLGRLDVGWHPRAAVIREEAQGKMRAQLTAFKLIQSELIVIVDDDNVLAPNYLEQVVTIATNFPFLGTWSGRIELKLEDPRNPPTERLRHLLAERLVESPVWSNDPKHVESTPWGAGMCIRRAVAEKYVEATNANPQRLRLDPQGDQLRYGGDTDVAYTGCSIGFGMGVFPSLNVAHLISKRRCTLDYLMKTQQAHAYSEILHHWVLTGIVPQRRSDLRARVMHWMRWLAADSLDRKVIGATQRGHTAARQQLEASP